MTRAANDTTLDGLESWYPLRAARAHGHLEVGDGHVLYWEESGNPEGIPVLFLHGGPGSGCVPSYRRFFDPERYRIVMFDQRGAGRSRPFAGIAANTTPHLIQDIETLRAFLGVSRWVLFGGSWGSTLALAYGQAYPGRVLGFILRGVFLFRRREVDWFIHGMGRFFPEAGRAFLGALPAAERADPLPAYYRRLCDPDPACHGPAARAWAAYEDACSRLIPDRAPARRPLSRAASRGEEIIPQLAIARLEAHYMVNDGFLRENQLLDGAGHISHLPCAIVQGRYDMVCPIESADALYRAWPGSNLTVVPDAGHSALEPGIKAALVTATDHFAEVFSN